MSVDIEGRPVLRPAGNVSLATKITYPRKPCKKPLPSLPPLKPTSPVPAKISPPNSLPSTPRIPKSPVSKPPPSPKLPLSLSPKKLSTPPSHKPSPPALIQNDAPVHPSPIRDCSPLHYPSVLSSTFADSPLSLYSTNVGPASHPTQQANACAEASSEPDLAEVLAPHIPSNEPLYDLDSVEDELVPHLLNVTSFSACSMESPSHASIASPQSRNKLVSSEMMSTERPRKLKSRAVLTRSSSEVLQRGACHSLKTNVGSHNKNFNSIGGHSLDEVSLVHLVAAKKAAASELVAQRKLKVAEYGRKVGKVGRVVPYVPSPLLVSAELERCKFITAQSDPLYVAYHDEEWGVPVHDDRHLFELLVLAGAQVELSWTTILHRRDTYRDAFCGYDFAAVALFNEKYVQSLEADKFLLLPAGKVWGVVKNAKRILEVIKEFGSFDSYLWGFLNKKAMVNNYRYPKQVPAKTSKSELISKDLVKRGFRFVGPTIIYSFMQAAGMTNDHLVHCFRHQVCASVSLQAEKSKGLWCNVECDVSLCEDEDPKVLMCELNKQTQQNEQLEIVHI